MITVVRFFGATTARSSRYWVPSAGIVWGVFGAGFVTTRVGARLLRGCVGSSTIIPDEECRKLPVADSPVDGIATELERVAGTAFGETISGSALWLAIGG